MKIWTEEDRLRLHSNIIYNIDKLISDGKDPGAVSMWMALANQLFVHLRIPTEAEYTKVGVTKSGS